MGERNDETGSIMTVVLVCSLMMVAFIWVCFTPRQSRFRITSDIRRISIHLIVKGMMCSGCQASVSSALEGIPGVSNVEVSYSTGMVKLKYDPNRTTPEELIEAIEKVGYKAHSATSSTSALKNARDARVADLSSTRKRLLIGIAPAILALALSVYGMFSGIPLWAEWVVFGLAIFVLFSVGGHLFKDAYRQALARHTNMSTLVVVGVIASTAYSLMSLAMKDLTGGAMYIDGAIVIVMLVSLGHWLRARSELSAMRDVFDLADLLPQIAHVAVGQITRDITPSELKPGDEVIVRASERIPTDGVVIDGQSEVMNAHITGEAMPVQIGKGDKVLAGAVNQDGSIRVRCECTGGETVVSRVVEMIGQALTAKPRIGELVDRIASIFVPTVLTVAIIVFNVWLFLGNLDLAVLTSISVLVISCPCALGLATPTALSVALGVSSRAGILIKDGNALQTMLMAKTFIFDKTGTLTEGKPSVNSLNVISGIEVDLIRLAVSAEVGSEHVLADAIREYAKQRGVTPSSAKDFKALPGLGVRAVVDGKLIHVGGPRLIEHLKTDLPISLVGAFNQQSAVFFVISDGIPLGGFGLTDPIREGAGELIDFLKGAGIEPILLSGDRREVCEAVADKLGIERVYSQMLPDEKLTVVKSFSEDGVTVMMGDGVNDAPALALADVSIAPGGGTGLALDVAGVTLMRDNLELVITAFKLARATTRNISWSLFWAFAYNVLAIPIAAGVLYTLGILLNPMIASGAMALSSLMVVLNALRLKQVELR